MELRRGKESNDVDVNYFFLIGDCFSENDQMDGCFGKLNANAGFRYLPNAAYEDGMPWCRSNPLPTMYRICSPGVVIAA